MVISVKSAILHFHHFVMIQFEILMYYDCNLYLFTFLVSYTVILVVYDCCRWFVLYPHVNVQRGSCHFKVWENIKF